MSPETTAWSESQAFLCWETNLRQTNVRLWNRRRVFATVLHASTSWPVYLSSDENQTGVPHAAILIASPRLSINGCGGKALDAH